MELTLSCILERVHYSTHLYEIMSNKGDWSVARGILIKGGVAVLPTDTIYGLHCLASEEDAVERIYRLKGRNFSKPFIILVSDKKDVGLFGIKLDTELSKTLDNYWPGSNSIVLSVTDGRFSYLHRVKPALWLFAYRLSNHSSTYSIKRDR